MQTNTQGFGIADASYQAAGGIEGITRLVDVFYLYMDTLPSAVKIRQQHPSDLALSKQKLAYFLSGWLGGPKLYREHFGSINIPSAHRHLNTTLEDRDQWLLCMQKAINEQPYSVPFKDYLYTQLQVPANRIVQAGNAQRQAQSQTQPQTAQSQSADQTKAGVQSYDPNAGSSER